MSVMVPKRVFFTRGVGFHKEELRSFEIALRHAGIEKCNLVTVLKHSSTGVAKLFLRRKA